MGSAASVTAYLRAPAKRTVGVVRMTVGGMRIGVGGVRMAAGGMRIGVGACEWLSEDANRCRCVRKAVDFEKRVVSVLRANQCWLGMRISVGTNANTQGWPDGRGISGRMHVERVAGSALSRWPNGRGIRR